MSKDHEENFDEMTLKSGKNEIHNGNRSELLYYKFRWIMLGNYTVLMQINWVTKWKLWKYKNKVIMMCKLFSTGWSFITIPAENSNSTWGRYKCQSQYIKNWWSWLYDTTWKYGLSCFLKVKNNLFWMWFLYL